MTAAGGAVVRPALPVGAVCAGLSVRWLAEALHAQGVVVHALDCFGDSDTRAVSAQWHPLGGSDGRVDAACLSRVGHCLPEASPLWYGAGFEGVPHLLGTLAKARQLVGNAPAVLARASTPSAWIDALQSCGLAAPATALVPSQAALLRSEQWLIKQGGTSGGGHVRRWVPGARLPEGGYLQRFVPGYSLGVTFLADGDSARVIGTVRHLRLQRALAGPFAQGGIIECPSIGHGLHRQLESGVARLVRHWGLVGVNGVDVIAARDGRLWWLELNARLPGSLALAPAGHPWVRWHWQLAGPSRCRLEHLEPALPVVSASRAGSVPMPLHCPPACALDPPEQAHHHPVRAQTLFRAPAAAVVPMPPAWPPWVHDRPPPAGRVAAGEPFATVSAEGSSAREALLTLRCRMNILAAHPAFFPAVHRAADALPVTIASQEDTVSSSPMTHASVNRLTQPIVDDLIRRADALRLAVTRMENGTTLVDAGQSVAGGLEAGRIIGEICMGGLGRVSLRASEAQPHWSWHLDVHSSNPVLACLASQYAGWSLSHGEGKGAFKAMGSGPGRALGSKEPLFEELGYRDDADTATLVLEVDGAPPVELADRIAGMCRVEPSKLTLILTPTSSLAGSVQVVARVLEVALHKVHTLHFPLEQVIDGAASAPVCPPGADFLTAMGRTNDAILFAGQVHLFVRCADEAAEKLALELPASASKDYGRPFAQVFKAVNYDFYQIDPLLFSPARAVVTNLATGRTFHGGRIDLALLDQSFGIT